MTFNIEPKYSRKTYVGNWNNRLAIEEARLKVTEYKSEHNQLLVWKTKDTIKNILEPVKCATAIETVLYGCKYQIMAPSVPNTTSSSNSQSKGLLLSGLMTYSDMDMATNYFHGCALTGSPNKTACLRNCFYFKSLDGNEGSIKYGDNLLICLCRSSGYSPLYVETEINSINDIGKLQYARLSSTPSVYCSFKFLHANPRLRKDTLESAIKPYSPLIIQQVSSGKNLALEVTQCVQTLLGLEWLVSCNTYRNQYHVETAENIWQIIGRREPDKGMMIRAAKGEDIPEEYLI